MTVDDVMDILVKFSFKKHLIFLAGGFANRKMKSLHHASLQSRVWPVECHNER